MRRLLLSLLLLLSPLAAQADLRVAFLNPGSASEPFWANVDAFLQAAAGDLGVALDIRHGDRDHRQLLAAADAVIAARPDFVLAVNEKGVGVELVKRFNKARIPVMLVLNDLDQVQQQKMGLPRQRYPYWLGSLVPDNLKAGEEVASALAAQVAGQQATMVALGGDRSTPAGLLRQAGLLKASRSQGNIHLAQLSYGLWQQARAQRQTTELLRRYPDLKLVWTANDLMAFGAIDAIRAAGKVPGKDVLVGTFNSSDKALRLRQGGSISALAAGHFMAPGLALVLLVDYQNGFDFAKDDGLQLHLPLFHLLVPGTPLFDLMASKDWQQVQFRAMSKVHNPYPGPHRFDLQTRAPQ